MVYNYKGESVVIPQTGYNLDGDIVSNPPSGAYLQIMTYNVQNFGGSNQTSETDLIFANYPDLGIIGIQEYSSNGIDSKASYFAGKGFTYHYLSDREKATNQKSVESKYQMTDIYEKTFDQHGSELRSYQKMYFTIDSKRICLVNAHLDYTPKATLYAQANELLNAVKNEEYFIVVGDLNTKATSKSDNDYINVIKPFVDLGFHTANFSDQFGFLNTWSGGTTLDATDWWQTDHIITSGNIYITDVIVDMTKFEYPTGYATDHLPVVANLIVA